MAPKVLDSAETLGRAEKSWHIPKLFQPFDFYGVFERLRPQTADLLRYESRYYSRPAYTAVLRNNELFIRLKVICQDFSAPPSVSALSRTFGATLRTRLTTLAECYRLT